MPKRTVLQSLDMSASIVACWLILATFAALARGFPASAPQEDDSNSGPLPFIQFTKGGIRVNFGGYHAQAGLGGLLTGSKADGGLHASAGTPTGAHASAGLGGTLDGGPAGGLHARAGLGNGGPEAEAGLAGSLAGPKPQGEIFAGSSAGNLEGIENSILRREKTKGKNIQVISRSKKANEVDAAASATTNTNDGGDPKAKESSSGSTTSTGASVNNGDESIEKSKNPAYWYFRKRLAERVAPINKTTSTDNGIESPDQATAEEISTSTSTTTKQGTSSSSFTTRKPWQYGIFTRSTETGGDNGSKFKSKGTLFDDIFNIPISALNAVNQLLKNHVGKKK